MKLTVNGDALEIDRELTITGLIERLELSDGPVAVERNGEVVPRASHAVTKLADGDEVEIMHFVGGG
jgi:sulfur carrier protein